MNIISKLLQILNFSSKLVYNLKLEIMYKKWKPNQKQRRAFAIKMQDTEEQIAYEKRKNERLFKSSFVPTLLQHDFCVFNRPKNLTSEQEDACNLVATAFACNVKIEHYYIHIVNELIRKEKNYASNY
jgi:hypothetical protein